MKMRGRIEKEVEQDRWEREREINALSKQWEVRTRLVWTGYEEDEENWEEKKGQPQIRVETDFERLGNSLNPYKSVHGIRP